MGQIKQLLYKGQLPEREPHNSRLFVDLSENVHIHHRELRLMFDVEEFFEFSDILKMSARDVKKYLRQHPEYKEQQIFDGVMVAGGSERQIIPLEKSPKPHESNYFPNRIQIELQDEKVIDAIHIHYRDFRLVMNIETFKEFVNGMKVALNNLNDFLSVNDYQEGQHPFRQVVSSEQWAHDRITLFQKMKYKIKRLLGKSETN